MSLITDNWFARISKETLVRNPNTAGALTWNDISFDATLTINEKISTITWVNLSAVNVINTPSWNISSINTQSAINELDIEKVGIATNDTISWVKSFLWWTLTIRNIANTFSTFFTSTLSWNRTITLRDLDGTMAYTSDITWTNSGTNTGDETLGTLGTKQFAASGKATPVNADGFNIFDSATLNTMKLLTFSNLKAFLKTYFDTLYADFTTNQIFTVWQKTFSNWCFALYNVESTFRVFFTNTITADRTITIRDITGTMALTTDITGVNSGTNTGDQTTISGNAGSATILQTTRTIAGVPFNGSANIAIPSTSLSDTASIALLNASQTITNKRNQPRIVSAVSYTTDTGTSLDFSTCDIFIVTAQAGVLLFNNPSGTPVHWEKIIIRCKDNGTARALTYGTQYRALWVTLPTTTVISKTLYLGGVWNATDTKLDIIAVAQEV